MRIYLSPSTQDWNAYAGGSNEEVQMRAVCFPAADILRAAGHEVRVGGTVSARANAEDGNAWGADLYVAVHSNAGGGHGTEAWHFTGSERGKALAEAVYARVAAVSTAPDRGVKSSTGYIELHVPSAPATIIELAFHDCAEEAQELRTQGAKFAEAVAQGVMDVAGGSAPAPVSDDPGLLIASVRDSKSTRSIRNLEADGITAVFTPGIPVASRDDIVRKASALGRYGVEHWREL